MSKKEGRSTRLKPNIAFGSVYNTFVTLFIHIFFGLNVNKGRKGSGPNKKSKVGGFMGCSKKMEGDPKLSSGRMTRPPHLRIALTRSKKNLKSCVLQLLLQLGFHFASLTRPICFQLGSDSSHPLNILLLSDLSNTQNKLKKKKPSSHFLSL